ncbi:DNA helicase B-like isoform X2 [Xyrauchen texanus]|uniref:DNA helicase B-like isoform X2 n=1 Tax=Xyrauchen texanus TaxID=154827 RepID=UPI00224217D5|nr:DNA helicase B-like isoform X2 [Xyrauchen texanus]
MALQGSPTGLKTITGYILPERHDVRSNQSDVSESEDEEEEIQPEFLDMREMDSISSGGKRFTFSMPASKEDFKVDNMMYRVEGRFPLRDPWWKISCTVGQGKHKSYVKSYLSYSLRTNLRSEGRSLVSLFLNACGALPDFVKTFMEWLPEDRYVEPVNVQDALQDFEVSKPEHKAIAEQLKTYVNHSVAGTHVRVANLYPGIMKYVPTLLPGQFMEIISKGKMEHKPEPAEKDDSIQSSPQQQQQQQQQQQHQQQQQDNTDFLAKLEELIKTDVWKLGFNYIMFKELHLIRCEAKLEAFKLCNLFEKIPVLQRICLQLYAEVKRYCSATGSTYIEREKLEKKIYREVQDVNAWKAVHFLVDQGVLIKDKTKYALRNLFNYEKGIAECLRSLVNGKLWTIDLDVSEVLRNAQLERIRVKASKKDNTRKSDAKTSVLAQNHVDQGIGSEQKDLAQPGTSSMDQNGGIPPLCDSSQAFEIIEPTIKEESLTSDIDSLSDSALIDSTYLDPDPTTIELDPDQVRAAEMMCANPVTVISGKGGCGKTTVVSLVFKAAMQQQTSDMEEVLKACEVFQNDSQGSSNGVLSDSPKENQGNEESDSNEKPMEVLLTAPTGRAASLLTKRTGFTAYTMHQILWSFMNAKKDQGNPVDWKFSQVRVLVVDEGSLVSVQILHSILSMLTQHAQLQKFVILGDVRQLPSIEPGNTLNDLFEGLRKIRWAIEMQTNHRAESELIVRNAGLISEMGKKRHYSPLEFDATIDMTKSSDIPSPDKRFIFVKISGEVYDYDLQNTIKFLLEKAPGLKDDKTSQFVAFRRKDCELINELCCKHYSGHITKTHKNQIYFQKGDKVCCTKNGYVSEKDNENNLEESFHDKSRTSFKSAGSFSDTAGVFGNTAGSQRTKEQMKVKKERLCNGEIFFIKEDLTEEDMGLRRKKRRYLTLDDENGRIVTSSYRELQRECKLRHAWARTIHTFQGSEAETIVYVLGDGWGQNWQHVYTAVTRGQKRVYVVGRVNDIERAMKKPVIPRNTRLGSHIRSIVARPGNDSFNQSGSTQSPVDSSINKSFGPSQIAGLGPSQSTPLALHTPSFSQVFSRPSCVKHLYREETGQNIETSNMILQDDMTFSQTYSWSPMDICDEPSTMHNANVSELSNHVEGVTLLGAISSSLNESSKTSKRLVFSDNCSTPSKHPKQTTSEESPLGSSHLKLLSITSPSIKCHGRQLFQEDS